jgi:hypothetical protein
LVRQKAASGQGALSAFNDREAAAPPDRQRHSASRSTSAFRPVERPTPPASTQAATRVSVERQKAVERERDADQTRYRRIGDAVDRDNVAAWLDGFGTENPCYRRTVRRGSGLLGGFR